MRNFLNVFVIYYYICIPAVAPCSSCNPMQVKIGSKIRDLNQTRSEYYLRESKPHQQRPTGCFCWAQFMDLTIHGSSNPYKKDISNYRPIVTSKILEKVVHKNVYTFLEKNKVLYASQYGFRKNRSTVNAITELVCHITNAFENKQNTLSVFLDLSKAFDTIDHDILLHKLECYGVRGLALNWFQSYLTDRKQYVLYNTVQSHTLGITCGVPQGSALGPLLFLIYVNDIANCLTHSKLIYFADDTTVFLSSKCINDLYKNMNSDLDDLTNWFKANRLAINVNKCHCMLFQPNGNQNTLGNTLNIGVDPIEHKVNCKFLGIFIDNQLRWNNHLSHISAKLSRSVYIYIKNSNTYSTLDIIKVTLLYNGPTIPYLWDHFMGPNLSMSSKTSIYFTTKKQSDVLINHTTMLTPNRYVFAIRY